MNKSSYLSKYETLTETDSLAGKEAKKTVSKMKDFLKESALEHLKTVEGIDLKKQAKKKGKTLTFKLDEKPSGTVEVRLTEYDPMEQQTKSVLVYHVQKRSFLN